MQVWLRVKIVSIDTKSSPWSLVPRGYTDTPPTSIAVTPFRIVSAVVVVATHGIQEPDAALGHADHGIVAEAAAPSRFHPFNHPDLLLVQSNVFLTQVIYTLHGTAGRKEYKFVTFI